MNPEVNGAVTSTDEGLQISGSVAQRLLQTNGDVSCLRQNDTLQDREWEHFDPEILRSYRDELVGVADLKSRDLIYDLGGRGLAFPVMKYQTMSNAGNAYVSMTGLGRGEADLPTFDLRYFPLPILCSDWFLDYRHLEESRNMGTNLDTTMAENAGAEVAQLQENILFNGFNQYSFGGGTIYGYTDYPHRHIGTLRGSWTDSSTTGEMMVNDIRDMKQDLIDDKQTGPFGVYVPQGYMGALGRDYTSNYPKTIRQRIEEEHPDVEFIKTSLKLDADNVVMLQLKKSTIRMVTGLALKNLEWQEQGGLVFKFKVMSIDVPQIRSDATNRCGIAHYNV